MSTLIANNSATHHPAETSLQTLLIFTTPYGFLLSYLYLLGYWSTLGVNIFQWIALPDILTYALVPITGVLILLTLCTFLLIPSVRHSVGDVASPQRGIASIVFSGLRAFSWLLPFLPPGLIILILRDSDLFLALLQCIAMAVIYVVISRFGLLPDVLRFTGRHRWVSVVVIALPFVLYDYGTKGAETILLNHSYRYFDPRDLRSDPCPGVGERVKLLGKAGDYFLCSCLDNSTIIALKHEDFLRLIIRKK